MIGLKIEAKYRMLLFLVSAWMIGAGFRFIMMKPSEIYTYSLFDKIFDWGIMFVLGIVLFIYTIFGYYTKEKKYEEMVCRMADGNRLREKSKNTVHPTLQQDE